MMRSPVADDRIDFTAARRDPKPLVGFSDATVLQLALWKHCSVVGIRGDRGSYCER
jgi:muramoyltetrapeptide carboxypeptidase